jgi:glycerophosphoryl diester phosphodiesterase
MRTQSPIPQAAAVADTTGAPRASLASLVSRDLRVGWRSSFVFHLLMQLLGLALFTPLVSWVADRIVLAAGEAVISNYDIARFVLSPTGGAFVVAVAALTLGLVLAELAGQSFIAGNAIRQRPVRAIAAVAAVAPRLAQLTVLSARVFLRLAILALPFLGAAGLVWLTSLAGRDINYYLAENPPEWQRAKLIVGLLAVGYALLAAWQLVRWIYAVPMLVLDGASPADALVGSARLTKNRVVAIASRVFLWWLAVTAAAVAVVWACRPIADAGLAWAGIDFQRVLPLVALYVTSAVAWSFLYSAVHVAGHQFLITRMYAAQVDPSSWRASAAETNAARGRHFARAAVIAIFGLLGVALLAGWFVASRMDLTADVAVTAHRGASIRTPENTMAAFRAAIEAGATYTELDVQLTRDRRIAVLHDGDLLRIGDDPRKVSELTATELAGIDIGQKYDVVFAGERVPTLEEVIELLRGKMKINVELKYNVPDPELAPAVIDLLRRENFLDEVVITSLDYAALRQVESIEPSLRTGHIVTTAIGDVVRSDADFLSMSSAQATRSLIRRAHAAGKEVHVWTVNEPEVMLRMIERGVDNVITDDPALFVRVLRERNALSKPEILGLGLRVLFSRAPAEVTDPAAVEQL